MEFEIELQIFSHFVYFLNLKKVRQKFYYIEVAPKSEVTSVFWGPRSFQFDLELYFFSINYLNTKRCINCKRPA